MRYVLDNPKLSKTYVVSDETEPKIYFSLLSLYAPELKEKNKTVSVVGKEFLVC